jgi:hypothetical protein
LRLLVTVDGLSRSPFIEELRFVVSAGINAIRPGIVAVTARIETGRLKIIAGACPNLLREASLYRYSDNPTDRRSESPVDEHNHALDALRYMVSMIDQWQMARFMGKGGADLRAGQGTQDQVLAVAVYAMRRSSGPSHSC